MQVSAFSKCAALFCVMVVATVAVIEAVPAFKPVSSVLIKNKLGGLLTINQTQPSQQVLSVQPEQEMVVARIERPLPFLGKKGAPYTWRGVFIMSGGLRVNVAVVYKNGELFYSISDGAEDLKPCPLGPLNSIKRRFNIPGSILSRKGFVELDVIVDPLNMFYQQLKFTASETSIAYNPSLHS